MIDSCNLSQGARRDDSAGPFFFKWWSIALLVVLAPAAEAAPLEKSQNPLPIAWDDSVIDRSAPTPLSFAPILAGTLESVVTIEVSAVPIDEAENAAGIAEPELGGKEPFFHGGSGLVLTSDGFVMTNAHVVDSGMVCSVRIAGFKKPFEAEVIGRDEIWDVALLKIKVPKPLKAAVLASGEPEIGDTAFVIGNPYGIGKTVTKGIVSALERRGVSRAKNAPANFIQTDAPIHPGNSGGPLVDVKGRVLGVNSQVDDHTTAGAGLGYAIPISSVVRSCQKLWLNTHKQSGLFGLDLADLNVDRRADLKIPQDVDGVLVTRVVKDLPADKVGLKADDLIVAIDDAKVADEPSCHFKLSSTEPGKVARLKVFRQGNYVTVEPVAIARSEE